MDIEKHIHNTIKEAGGFDSLASQLLKIAQTLDIKQIDDFGDYEFIDVRLRFFDDNIYLYCGSSDYDQDHRGYWGASSLSADCDLDTAKSIASDLIDQVIECSYC